VDESDEVSFVLSQVRESLPAEVFRTCESLVGHGEWEMALSHCVSHLIAVPSAAKIMLETCARRLQASNKLMAAIAEL